MLDELILDHLLEFHIAIGTRTQQLQADPLNAKLAKIFVIDRRAEMGLVSDLEKVVRGQMSFFQKLPVRRAAVSLIGDPHIEM